MRSLWTYALWAVLGVGIGLPADAPTDDQFLKAVTEVGIDLGPTCHAAKFAQEGKSRVVIYECEDSFAVILFRNVNGKWKGYPAVYPDPDAPVLDL